jgi:tetratricopeptide (TPR) repeat protein
VSDAELKQFLSGMLVTSETRPVMEVVWPVQGLELAYQWVEESLKAGWGIENRDQLRMRLQASPNKTTRSDAWLLDRLSDYPSSLRVWKKLLHEDPNDLGAAIWVANLLEALEGPQAALDAIARTSGRTARIVNPRGRKSSPAQIETIRCELLLLARKPDEALKACNLASEIDELYGEVMVSPVLLAMGRKKEALVQANVVAKAPGSMLGPYALFALGLAQQENGLDKEAVMTWNVALARWPRNAWLLQAIRGARRTVFEWQEMMAVSYNRAIAKELAFCGRLYSELKLDARAAECYRDSERIQAGPALANKLVFLGTTSPAAALEQAKAAVKANPDVDLMTAAAWLLFQMKKVDEAMQWVDRALAADPYDVKASSLKWQLCGEQKDYVCLLQYRKRLGLPTHFDVAEYRDVERAFKEQALKNGEGLAMRELDSTSSPRPPPIREVEIIPLGNRMPAEMDHLADFLSTRFAGLKISVGSVEELPRGTYGTRQRSALCTRRSLRTSSPRERAIKKLLPPPAGRRCSVTALDHRKRLGPATELGLGDGAPIHLDAERDESGAIVVPRANHDLGPIERALKRNLGHLRRDSLAELGPETRALGRLVREWRIRRRGGGRRGSVLLSARRRIPTLRPFETIAETAVPGRWRHWVERSRRRIPAFGEDRDADDPHLARVASPRRVRV